MRELLSGHDAELIANDAVEFFGTDISQELFDESFPKFISEILIPRGMTMRDEWTIARDRLMAIVRVNVGNQRVLH